MSFNDLAKAILWSVFFMPACVVAQEDGEPGKTKGQTVIRISRETTVISGPLTEDGFVDYVAAANASISQGVTRENNGAIDFVQIMDPKDKWGFFKPLGIETPTLPAFLTWQDHINKIAPNTPVGMVNQLLVERSELQSRPWKSADNATSALWLQANQRPLDLLVEATKKERFYTPIASVDQTLVAVLLPVVQQSREVSRALQLRAMRRLGEGDQVGAWSDLQACHRLARQIGQGFTLIERLVGVAIETVAFSADIKFVQSAVLSPEEIKKYQLEIANLPGLPHMADAIDQGERLMFLDCAQLVAKRGLTALKGITGDSSPTPPFVSRLLHSSIDWNETMIVGNQWYDHCVAVSRIESAVERREAARKMDIEMQGLAPKMDNLADAAKLFFASKKTKGRAVGGILVGLLLPAFSVGTIAETRVVDYGQLVEIAFALEAYKIKNERYPAKLDELTPNLLAKVPQDLFKEAPYFYDSDGKKYLLYGIGYNFEDDGGTRGLDNVVASDLANMPD